MQRNAGFVGQTYGEPFPCFMGPYRIGGGTLYDWLKKRTTKPNFPNCHHGIQRKHAHGTINSVQKMSLIF